MSKSIDGLTDFQLAFLLHLYISLSDNSNIIKIRPNRDHFPLTLQRASQEIWWVLKRIDIFAEHIFITNNPYSSPDYHIDSHILFQGARFPNSMIDDTSHYKSQEWCISLIFNNKDKRNTLAVEHFLKIYIHQYMEENSENDYESIKLWERKLISLTYHRVWILDLDFWRNWNSMLIALMGHVLWGPDSPPEINILKNPEMEYFPYPIHFESNFVFFDNIICPLLEVNISQGVVKINNSIVLSDDTIEDSTRIISFLIQNSPMTHIGDIQEYLNPIEPTAKLCAKLKTKLNRIRDIIIKQTGYDLFHSVGRAKVELNTNLIVNIAKDTNSVK